ncbi:M48 family metallopeptidase [Pseudokordiimonas caeni]|uniref:M48 family metallopeptidase n=1 Tax=Pseudokordiimonas caeni TaxID=2997908 RepID=UPI00281253FA|nr:SprT family zinc-dependent metalloprotease [Pseudokordiimonas caeni]
MFGRLLETPLPDELSVALPDGGTMRVAVRTHATARRMVLRYDARTDSARVTVPKGAKGATVERFAAKHAGWLLNERQNHAGVPSLAHGGLLPFRGKDHALHFTGISPRQVKVADGAIHVGGPADQAPARLSRWLKAEAKADLEVCVRQHAANLGVEYGRVSVGDMSSRWGSCSSTGTLRFSWRLVLAPRHILDYVAAHEVAHLLEMNHSPAFWAHVARLVPNWGESRRWLRQEGAALMAVRLDGAPEDEPSVAAAE